MNGRTRCEEMAVNLSLNDSVSVGSQHPVALRHDNQCENGARVCRTSDDEYISTS